MVGSGTAVGDGVVNFTALRRRKLVALNTVLMKIDLGTVTTSPSRWRGRFYVGAGKLLWKTGHFERFFPK